MMGYQLAWEIPNSVLCLTLGAEVSMGEFVEINEEINQCLDDRENTDRIVLKIDAIETKFVPKELSRMKNSQTYANRLDVKSLLFVGEDKYVRLIMLLTFNLSRAILHFANDHDHAQRFMRNV